MLMKTRIEPVDFCYVSPEHREIDKRLVNWGRSQYSGGGGGHTGMWRWVKPSQPWDAVVTAVPVDRHDAMLIGKGIAHLPTPHALSLSWCYARKTSPKEGAKLLRTNMEGLFRFISDARTMLVNRKV